MEKKHVFGIVLAGGEGSRLRPLTRDRAKPAVPFGGNYRLIDFAISNLVNAGIRRIAVLTQYKSLSLDRHIAQAWRLSPAFNNYVMTVPAQMRLGKHWFQGSADAIYQNLNLIVDEQPDYICVFGADNIYRMDPDQMLDFHINTGAKVTIAGIRVPKEEASRFGVLVASDTGMIKEFVEKPKSEIERYVIPGAEDQVYASMGNYIFTTEALIDAVRKDAENKLSEHDMGGDIITNMVQSGDAAVYDFNSNDVPGQLERDKCYWRDVGTIDAFYEASMDLISIDPIFNLYNSEWPIHTFQKTQPPAKFAFDDDGRRGSAVDSLICPGVILSGSQVRRSIISPNTFCHSYSLIEDSVIMDNCDIGRHAIIKNCIIDKNVRIPPYAQIGLDPDIDRANGLHVSERGIVVIGKGDNINVS